MLTSYYDKIISELFLEMDPAAFKAELMSISDKLKSLYPERFGRFFIDSTTHSIYELDFMPGDGYFLEDGPRTVVNGVMIFDWVGQLVKDDPSWSDILE